MTFASSFKSPLWHQPSISYTLNMGFCHYNPFSNMPYNLQFCLNAHIKSSNVASYRQVIVFLDCCNYLLCTVFARLQVDIYTRSPLVMHAFLIFVWIGRSTQNTMCNTTHQKQTMHEFKWTNNHLKQLFTNNMWPPIVYFGNTKTPTIPKVQAILLLWQHQMANTMNEWPDILHPHHQITSIIILGIFVVFVAMFVLQS